MPVHGTDHGEPSTADDPSGTATNRHDDEELDQHPDAGQMPSDVEVQAERQEPLS